MPQIPDFVQYMNAFYYILEDNVVILQYGSEMDRLAQNFYICKSGRF